MTSQEEQSHPNSSILDTFQQVSAKFLQAAYAARESAVRDCARAWLSSYDQMREVEHAAYQAIVAATEKQAGAIDQKASGDLQEMFAGHARAQYEHHQNVQQIYADTQAKMRAIAEKNAGDREAVMAYSRQIQEAYQTYLDDLQKTWSGIENIDYQTMAAISSIIMSTIHAVSQLS